MKAVSPGTANHENDRSNSIKQKKQNLKINIPDASQTGRGGRDRDDSAVIFDSSSSVNDESENQHSIKNIIIAIVIICFLFCLLAINYLAQYPCTFGHSMQPASCTEPATCSVCSYTEGDPLGHQWDGETTCQHIATCSTCGGRKDASTLPHDPVDIRIDKEATCQEEGLESYTCRVCGEHLNNIIPVVEHKYPNVPNKHDDFYVTTDAVLHPSIDTYVCEVCQHEKTVELESDLTAEQENCIESALSYLKVSAFSRQKLIAQLEYEQYADNICEWSINHIRIDWSDQAYRQAKNYLRSSNFSYDGLMRQLTSQSGEGFLQLEAEYAMEKIDRETDWNEQAYQEAKSYLSTFSFSRDELIQQLESPHGSGFTHDQAVYGANKAYSE